MSLLTLLQRDANDLMNNLDGFAEVVKLVWPDGTEVGFNMIHTLHHLGYDLQKAQEINTLKAHAIFSEADVIAVGKSVRLPNGQVMMKNYRLKAKDTNGTEWKYIVDNWFPNGKVGTITLILGAHAQ